MSAGSIINLLSQIILLPIITRIYSKEDFGVLYLYMSIVGISALVSNGMYPHALVIPKFRRQALSLLKLCMMTSAVSVILCVIAVIILLNIDALPEKIESYAVVIPIGLMLANMNLILINWNVRKVNFTRNATSNVSRGAFVKLLQFFSGLFVKIQALNLVFSTLIGEAISIAILFSKKTKIDFFALRGIRYVEIQKTAVEFIKYPTYLLSSNFLNKVSGDIPLYIFTSTFGLGAVGAFGFANSVLSIPVNMIGNSLAPVYYQKANQLYQTDKQQLRDLTLGLYNKLLLISCLVFGFVFTFGDVVFDIFFGKEWKLAGQIAMILSVHYIFLLISSPLARIFRVYRKEEYSLKVSVMLAVFRCLGLFIGMYLDDLIIAIALFTAGNVIGYLYNNYKIFNLLEISNLTLIKKTLPTILIIFSLFQILRLAYNSIL